MRKVLVQIAVAIFVISSVGCAATAANDNKSEPAQAHDGHHPEGGPSNQKAQSGMKGQGGMMGDMNMDGMMGMMNQCMAMHKDGKMCDHEMMEKCQAQMSKGECQKMMKQAKTKTKSDSKAKQ